MLPVWGKARESPVGLVNLLAPRLADWPFFWWNNWIDHQEIQQAIQKVTTINDTIYVIIPWNQDGADALLEKHQQYHNDMNDALNLGGQDLSNIDFKNPAAIQQWAWLHYQEHLAAHEALGI